MRAVIALSWGFAEATFFFLVPDIYLTWLALRRPRALIYALPLTLLGALLGGLLMYGLGTNHARFCFELLDWLPAVGPGLIEESARQLRSQGDSALLLGSVTGTPYKLYALWAGAQDMGMIRFALISIPARLMRWCVLIALSYALGRAIRRYAGERVALAVLGGAWLINYVIYFSLMQN